MFVGMALKHSGMDDSSLSTQTGKLKTPSLLGRRLATAKSCSLKLSTEPRASEEKPYSPLIRV